MPLLARRINWLQDTPYFEVFVVEQARPYFEFVEYQNKWAFQLTSEVFVLKRETRRKPLGGVVRETNASVLNRKKPRGGRKAKPSCVAATKGLPRVRGCKCPSSGALII